MYLIIRKSQLEHRKSVKAIIGVVVIFWVNVSANFKFFSYFSLFILFIYLYLFPISSGPRGQQLIRSMLQQINCKQKFWFISDCLKSLQPCSDWLNVLWLSSVVFKIIWQSSKFGLVETVLFWLKLLSLCFNWLKVLWLGSDWLKVI